ncbi:MAG: 4Fe-4S binding protein [Actinomycetia bacterium]|nr:4Fe-4S binding protein [Actinomycetes bacterium]
MEVEPKTGARFASPGELDEFKKLVRSDRYSGATSVSLCTGPGCLAVGSGEVLEAFKGELEKKGLSEKVVLRGTGCHGFCERGPVVVIKPENIFYQRVAVDDVAEIVSETITQGRVIDRLLYEDPITGTTVTRENAVPYYSKQNRQILGPNVDIDPCEIGDFIATGGYSAMAKALFDMEPDQIIDEVDRAGLRGRGGGGFPAASKWKSCRDASSPDGVKYVLCNADEGDPGAFMDRCLLEGNPHSVLEGMVIGARAIGANNGYIYVRNEYPLAVTAVTRAIEHTAVKGLYLRPTNLNNVETWANVPLIIKEGADAYAQVGTENSKGTKIFSLVGKIKNTGLVEVPMGISLREIIYDIGGGIPGGKKFKAVQTGGPSGGCIPESLIDIPVDFDRLAEVGSMMGSGGMIVMDEDTCMVDIARYFLEFLCDESCGKCTPCREGLKHMLEIIDEITKGRGSMERLDLLEELADVVRDTSLCGLGQTAPNPVLSTIRYFKEEYRQHIEEKRCTAGVCKALISFEINQDACNGCTRCAKACPSGAISGEKKEPHRIDAEKCDKCGICYEVCEFDAVVRK